MTLQQIGNYRLDSLLDSGGMGEVYKAYDTHRDRYVALKLLPEAFSGDPEYLRRFQRESHVAARLREPHIIPIHDFGEIGGRLFIDMRLVDGTDIGALLDANGPIPPQRAVNLISQVAQALDAAHADHLVHRDIKPSNILVTQSDFVYVVDFGIARPIGGQQTSLTITGATMGTLHYMAPERFAGHDIDGRTDVYSLACVLHECLTGAPPFRDKDLPALMYAQLYYAPPQASRLVEGIPPALDGVIARGMAKDREDRFATAGELAEAAREALLTEAPTSPPLTTELQPPTRADIRTPAMQAAAVLAARQGVARPPGPEAEPAGNRSAQGVPLVPAQTMLPDSADNWGGTQPPASMPQGISPDPGGSGLPPREATGEPDRRSARRRLGLLILAGAVALAIPIALVLIASNRPNTSGATGTGPTGATSSGPSAAPNLAVPTSGGTITVGHTPSYIKVAPNGEFAYTANPGAGAITVLNTANDLVTGTIKIPQGPPQSVAFSPDSRTAYVSVYNTNGSAHCVVFINTATGTVTATVPVNNFTPGPSATSPDGRYLYVPNHNSAMTGTNENLVDVIDTVSKELVGWFPVPANPHWVVFGKNNGRFYITDHMSATVTVLNAQTHGTIAEIPVGETPHSEAISPDDRRLAVTSYDGNEVFLIDTATDTMIKQIPVGKLPLDITYSPNGRYLFTADNSSNTVTVINTADNRVIAEIPTGKMPTSIAVLPNGRQAYVTDEGDGTIEILNIAK